MPAAGGGAVGESFFYPLCSFTINSAARTFWLNTFNNSNMQSPVLTVEGRHFNNGKGHHRLVIITHAHRQITAVLALL